MQVLSVRGDAGISYDGGKVWTKLKVNSPVRENCAFRTGRNSTVDLGFRNAAAIRITTNSAVGIDKFEFEKKDSELQLDLREGHLFALSTYTNRPPKSKFEIKTPVGVAGVLAPTGFSLNDRGVLQCKWGSLVMVYVVANALIPPYQVGAGQSISFSKLHGEVRAIGAEDLQSLAAELQSLESNFRAASWNTPKNRIRISKAHP